MALYDAPPHLTSVASSVPSTDAGGGVTLTYTTVMSDVPCSINTVSGTEAERFAQMGLEVSHVVAYLTSALSTSLVRGMKITDSDGNSYHVEGIRKGRAYGSIPAFTYANVRQLL